MVHCSLCCDPGTGGIGVIVISTFAVSPAFASVAGETVGSNPRADTETARVPGCTATMRYEPSAAVSVVSPLPTTRTIAIWMGVLAAITLPSIVVGGSAILQVVKEGTPLLRRVLGALRTTVLWVALA
jgi:hypothetical protein